MRTFSFLIVGAVTAWLPGAALAADAAVVPAARQVVRAEAGACLRWVWQQYSWYDDCWAARHPYIGGRVVVRVPRH